MKPRLQATSWTRPRGQQPERSSGAPASSATTLRLGPSALTPGPPPTEENCSTPGQRPRCPCLREPHREFIGAHTSGPQCQGHLPSVKGLRTFPSRGHSHFPNRLCDELAHSSRSANDAQPASSLEVRGGTTGSYQFGACRWSMRRCICWALISTESRPRLLLQS